MVCLARRSSIKSWSVYATTSNTYAIRKACEKGHLKVAKLLLQNSTRVDPAAESNEALSSTLA
jgi:hypothetical protein